MSATAMHLRILVVSLLVYLCVTSASGKSILSEEHGREEYTCGYQSCHATDPNKLNVHLIPHSHDDVGWLKTVDQYFYGSKNSIQRAGVQHIIGSVVEALKENPDRRFIQVETAFFWQWWKKQTAEKQEEFRSLVNSGQLEIINGAWSMNDEAAAHYTSIVDQFTWGLRIINDTLGECSHPKIGWQIDPFGHSSEMASIFARLGYEAVFFARLDYRDKERRQDTKNLELIWQGSRSLGASTRVFTHAFSDFYTQPSNFCWDVLCTDEPLNDDEDSPDYNVKQKVEDFTEYVEKRAEHFQTNNLLVNMGGDFTYQAALMYYTNIDKLIEGFKRYSNNITLIYSTPSCYLKAVNEAAQRNNTKFELKTDDFFPYTSDKHSSWTGYYTSRPNSKRLERTGNNILQAAKQLTSFAFARGTDYSGNLTLLKEAMGIMQHHDAITGTEKQAVAQDYARILTKAIKTAENNLDNIIFDLLRKNASDTTTYAFPQLETCLLANVSYCEPSASDRFVVAVYNPLSRTTTDYIRLPVNATSFSITGPNNASVAYDLMPTIANFSYVHNINPSNYDLVFKVEQVPSLGVQLYYIEAKSSTTKEQEPTDDESTAFTYLGTNTTGFAINTTTGLLQSVTINGISLNIAQQFLYYNGANGTNEDDDHKASGAYIFRPANITLAAVPFADAVVYNITQGDIVDEVYQEFNAWIKQIIRVYKNADYIEFDWLVGPIELINELGVEIITRFTTELANNGTFYTDSNGREMIQRVRNYRETYNYTDEEPVAGNYYPITSRIVIKDDEKKIQLAVLNDRAQGGSSLQDGVVELMVHRRLLNDDALGVEEPLDENEFGQKVIARGQHYLTFGNTNADEENTTIARIKSLVQQKLLAPVVLVGDATKAELSLENLQNNFNFTFAGLNKEIAENLQVLTLEPWKDNTLLLRLEHLFEIYEDTTRSEETLVTIDFFALFNVTSIRETTLGANKWLEDVEEKFQWNLTELYDDTLLGIKFPEPKKRRDVAITLKPMEIRTFVVDYAEWSEEEEEDDDDDGNDGDDDGDDDDDGEGEGGGGEGGEGGDGGEGDADSGSSLPKPTLMIILIMKLLYTVFN